MSLIMQLGRNKGTLSSTLSKKLAKEVLSGNIKLLEEAVPLVVFNIKDRNQKHIRIGAAIIVDAVAKEQPSMVAPYLGAVLHALEAEEPQTRWIIIRTLGNCAAQRPDVAKLAVAFARKYIAEKKVGQLCLVAAADMFLGAYGSLSTENTAAVYPILVESANNAILNEHDWIMEAFMSISSHLTKKQKSFVVDFAGRYVDHPRKATRDRVKMIQDCCGR